MRYGTHHSGIGPGKWTCDRHGYLFCRECLKAEADAAVAERRAEQDRAAARRALRDFERNGGTTLADLKRELGL